jgi:hypothetical protein
LKAKHNTYVQDVERLKAASKDCLKNPASHLHEIAALFYDLYPKVNLQKLWDEGLLEKIDDPHINDQFIEDLIAAYDCQDFFIELINDLNEKDLYLYNLLMKCAVHKNYHHRRPSLLDLLKHEDQVPTHNNRTPREIEEEKAILKEEKHLTNTFDLNPVKPKFVQLDEKTGRKTYVPVQA